VLYVRTSLVNCDQKIGCPSVHTTCPACCSFLSLTYPYIRTFL